MGREHAGRRPLAPRGLFRSETDPRGVGAACSWPGQFGKPALVGVDVPGMVAATRRRCLMWPFWLMFLIPAWAVLTPGRLPARQAWVAWLAVGIVFSVMMGLRHAVGGDWSNYLPHFNATAQRTLLDVLGRGDPGYYGVNWLVAQAGGSIYTVNLICAS